MEGDNALGDAIALAVIHAIADAHAEAHANPDTALDIDTCPFCRADRAGIEAHSCPYCSPHGAEVSHGYDESAAS
jgi:hypothetical protein